MVSGLYQINLIHLFGDAPVSLAVQDTVPAAQMLQHQGGMLVGHLLYHWNNHKRERFNRWMKYPHSLVLHEAAEQIDVERVSKVKENKEARDKHVLGLLTSLRAVFPGNVTQSIGRQILPYAKYDVVPDELQLKEPIKLKKKVQHEERKVQYGKKYKPSRNHQAPSQRR